MPEIAEKYWQFLVYKLISVSDERAKNYTYLLSYLFNKDFVWMQEFPLDSDREEDGYALRNEFMNSLNSRYNYSPEVSQCLGDQCNFTAFCQGKKASCLEVILALCIRICNEVYSTPEDGIIWLFWSMINNLGIIWADDNDFDKDIVDRALNSWLYRKYGPDGSLGNLFVFGDKHNRDIRLLTIWDQANLYMRFV